MKKTIVLSSFLALASHNAYSSTQEDRALIQYMTELVREHNHSKLDPERPILETIKTYLTDGASIHVENEENHTRPLDFAIELGNVEEVELFIALGADVNARSAGGVTPLMRAVLRGDLKIFQTLHQSGADLFAETDTDRNILDLAMDYERDSIMQYMLQTVSWISAVNRVRIGNYSFDASVYHVLPDGDCGFSALRIMREKYIQDVKLAFKHTKDEYLKLLIYDAMKQLNTSSIEEWAQYFDNADHWMDALHLRIFSRMYGIAIHVFVLDVENNEFVPHFDDREHIINESIHNVTSIANLVWTSVEQGEQPNHFDELMFNGMENPTPVLALSEELNIQNAPASLSTFQLGFHSSFFGI